MWTNTGVSHTYTYRWKNHAAEISDESYAADSRPLVHNKHSHMHLQNTHRAAWVVPCVCVCAHVCVCVSPWGLICALCTADRLYWVTLFQQVSRGLSIWAQWTRRHRCVFNNLCDHSDRCTDDINGRETIENGHLTILNDKRIHPIMGLWSSRAMRAACVCVCVSSANWQVKVVVVTSHGCSLTYEKNSAQHQPTWFAVTVQSNKVFSISINLIHMFDP